MSGKVHAVSEKYNIFLSVSDNGTPSRLASGDHPADDQFLRITVGGESPQIIPNAQKSNSPP